MTQLWQGLKCKNGGTRENLIRRTHSRNSKANYSESSDGIKEEALEKIVEVVAMASRLQTNVQRPLGSFHSK